MIDPKSLPEEEEEMNGSRPAVHPVEAEAAGNPLRVRMKDVQGSPGTPGGLALRLSQSSFAAAALCLMLTTADFASVTAFCYFVAAVILQCSWSLLLAFVDLYALLVKRCLRNSSVLFLFTIGDGITSTLTFTAACASAGITVFISNDINKCAGNHCTSFETATAMAYLCWFAVFPSFLLNFWSLASR
ncbi:CASP-like protein 5A1 [Phoenix dactylifera]|uniref:CASP-like protein n=1 Tax=Phoenix dactylifera TaxID=42345 RepID=A0A8B7C4D2_PHODC|nr:CASP-like protein 5A1 [Phoenix dactylifera]